jgi:hypothetical protein
VKQNTVVSFFKQGVAPSKTKTGLYKSIVSVKYEDYEDELEVPNPEVQKLANSRKKTLHMGISDHVSFGISHCFHKLI